jgi:hypothetical protein
VGRTIPSVSLKTPGPFAGGTKPTVAHESTSREATEGAVFLANGDIEAQPRRDEVVVGASLRLVPCCEAPRQLVFNTVKKKASSLDTRRNSEHRFWGGWVSSHTWPGEVCSHGRRHFRELEQTIRTRCNIPRQPPPPQPTSNHCNNREWWTAGRFREMDGWGCHFAPSSSASYIGTRRLLSLGARES